MRTRISEAGSWEGGSHVGILPAHQDCVPNPPRQPGPQTVTSSSCPPPPGLSGQPTPWGVRHRKRGGRNEAQRLPTRQEASSTNTDSVLAFVFQKTQNKITFLDVHACICESSEQQSNYSEMGNCCAKWHQKEKMLCGSWNDSPEKRL